MKKLNGRKEGLLTKLMRGLYKITKHKLFKNKLYGTILLILGFLTIKILDGDCTVCILTTFLSLILFFSKDNCITE